MKSGIYIVLITLISLSILSCSSQKGSLKNEVVPEKVEKLPEVKEFEKVAKEKYGSQIAYIPSPNNKFMLCINIDKHEITNPLPPLIFFIYDTETKSIIFEETRENGSVHWINNERIRVDYAPGQVKIDKKTPDYYIYDLIKKKKFIDIEEK
jgi:hypothetical protein